MALPLSFETVKGSRRRVYFVFGIWWSPPSRLGKRVTRVSITSHRYPHLSRPRCGTGLGREDVSFSVFSELLPLVSENVGPFLCCTNYFSTLFLRLRPTTRPLTEPEFPGTTIIHLQRMVTSFSSFADRFWVVSSNWWLPSLVYPVVTTFPKWGFRVHVSQRDSDFDLFRCLLEGRGRCSDSPSWVFVVRWRPLPVSYLSLDETLCP